MKQKVYCEDIEQSLFWCENCGKNTNKLWDSKTIGNDFGNHFYQMGFNEQASPTFKSKKIWWSTCKDCKDLTVWIQNTDFYYSKLPFQQRYFKNLDDKKPIYPLESSIHIDPNPDMSDDSKSLFLEALSIFDNSPKGDTALLRVVLENELRNINYEEYKEKSIGNILQLKEVKEKLGTKLIDSLNIIREFCNEGSHSSIMDFNELKKDQVRSLFDLINKVVSKLISDDKEISEITNYLKPKTDSQ